MRCYEVLVREDRALSLAVAERTGVRHESPQAILLDGGRPIWHASHRDVTAAAVAEACRTVGGNT